MSKIEEVRSAMVSAMKAGDKENEGVLINCFYLR